MLHSLLEDFDLEKNSKSSDTPIGISYENPVVLLRRSDQVPDSTRSQVFVYDLPWCEYPHHALATNTPVLP